MTRSRTFLAMIFGLGLVAVAPAWGAKLAPLPQYTPMTVVVVRSSDVACGANCPEWISAEGSIADETPAAFRRVFRTLGKRNLPVFIQSPGGSVEAALEIGRMLRERKMTVSVTATRFEGCEPSDAKCSKVKGFKAYLGTPDSLMAFCASACPYLLAGASERLVSAASQIGVHQMTVFRTMTQRQYRILYREIGGKKVEISRELISEKAVSRVEASVLSKDPASRSVQRYLKDMGVSDLLVRLADRAPSTDMYWLTRTELEETGLVSRFDAGESLVWPPEADDRPLAAAPVLLQVPSRIALDLGTTGEKPVGLVIDFAASSDPDLVDWTYAITLGNRLQLQPDAMIGVSVEGQTVIPVSTHRLRSLMQFVDGTITKTAFCRLAHPGRLAVAVDLATGAADQRESFFVERPAVPRVDRTLAARCPAVSG